MIVTPHEARAIAQGRKAMHRIPVHPAATSTTRCPYKPGSSHAIQPGPGQPSEAQIAILETRREPAGHITTADAKLEGNVNTDWWKQAWVRKHDRHWIKRELVDRADIYGDQVVPYILLARFNEHWAHREVWVIRFWLDEVRPRYMARPTKTSGDYTTSPEKSIDKEDMMVTGRDGIERLRTVGVPVANPEYVAAKIREDAKQARAQAASFARDLDAERFERARREAEAAGINTAGASRLVRRAAAALERAVDSNEKGAA
jgi:hypothetical protein